MTQFAWLQARSQTLITSAALAAIAILAAITGVHLAHLHHQLALCQSDCDFAQQQFLDRFQFLSQAFDVLARVVPALIGIFWGAPLLAREFESGSYRLAWTQSVTRSRWLLSKLGLGALVTVVLAGLTTLTISWWNTSQDNGTMRYAVFDRRDIAPIGYALFAFATGALLGAIIKRTVPAMVVTLAVFVFSRVALQLWVFPHLIPPVTRSLTFGGRTSAVKNFGIASFNGSSPQIVAQGSGPDGAWTLSSHLVNSAGQVPSSVQMSSFMNTYCKNFTNFPNPGGKGFGNTATRAVPSGAAQACFAQASKAFHVIVTYQPASRYWDFQWLETGVFVALALLAGVGCYRWITRH